MKHETRAMRNIHTPGRWYWLCTCGAKGHVRPSKGRAVDEGREHERLAAEAEAS